MARRSRAKPTRPPSTPALVRRQLGRAALGAGAVAVVVACSGGSDRTTSSSGSPPPQVAPQPPQDQPPQVAPQPPQDQPPQVAPQPPPPEDAGSDAADAADDA